MVNDLQQFLSANIFALTVASASVAALAVGAVRYGRRHEARTRQRGTGL